VIAPSLTVRAASRAIHAVPPHGTVWPLPYTLLTQTDYASLSEWTSPSTANGTEAAAT
jgi:hypothetical protein